MGMVEANLAGHRFVQVVAAVGLEITPGEDREVVEDAVDDDPGVFEQEEIEGLEAGDGDPGMAIRGGAARRLKAKQTRLK